jgi:proline dehydrogenase
VPVRVYVPFGPGWWPYAIDKALARPYLLSWMIKDRLGRPKQASLPCRTVPVPY